MADILSLSVSRIIAGLGLSVKVFLPFGLIWSVSTALFLPQDDFSTLLKKRHSYTVLKAPWRVAVLGVATLALMCPRKL